MFFMDVELCLTWRKARSLRVDNRVLRKIFRCKREVLTCGLTQLHTEDLCNLACSRNIIKVVKSRRMEWMGHIEDVEYMKYGYKIRVGKPKMKR
jgi:hypothetical protein